VTVRIGTRGSKLALAQSKAVHRALVKLGIEATLQIIKTSGDAFTDKPFRDAGIGVFVREIDELMLEGVVDIAVHSMKDIPTKRPPELEIAAVLPRASPYDVLVSEVPLGEGAVIGTSSLRRRAQVSRYCPYYRVKDIRGNVDTRLMKLRKGEYDGIILAEAGLERLETEVTTKRLPFVPSPNQGIIAVVAQRETEASTALRELNHEATMIEGIAERIIMEVLGGGCLVPLGILARLNGNDVNIAAEVLSQAGDEAVGLHEVIPKNDYTRYATALGKKLQERGGARLVAESLK
jgi:hydroxymethylbilane synthase